MIMQNFDPYPVNYAKNTDQVGCLIKEDLK